MSTIFILFIYATLLYLPIPMQLYIYLYDINMYWQVFRMYMTFFFCNVLNKNICMGYMYRPIYIYIYIYIYYKIVTISNSLFICFYLKWQYIL